MIKIAVGLCALLYLLQIASCTTPIAKFPLQMSFNLTLTAHQVAEDSEYPPRVRTLGIYYDYVNKRGRADIAEGYEAAKVHLRRYDDKKEYMVRLPPIDDCKRSNLLELMPYPLIPDATYVDQVDCPAPSSPTHGHRYGNEGNTCDYFVFTDYRTKVHMYFESQTGAPVKLVQESEDVEQGQDIPMLTYDYSDVMVGAPPPAVFELGSHHYSAVKEEDKEKDGESHTHDKCDLHAGGFPYLHVFHYFAKF